MTANEGVTLNATRPELTIFNFSNINQQSTGLVLPPSLSLASLTGDVAFGGDVPRLLYPSTVGQLSLLAGGEIQSLALAMSDADPSLLPGAFSVRNAASSAGGGLDFGFGGVFPDTTDVELRLLHNQTPTHAGDDAPARVYAGGSITGVTLSLAKQARIGAGLDIVDMVFTGQNVRDGDVTRITAGRDIIGTTAFSTSQRRPYINGNTFTLGGYGTLSIEAGRNLGPFLNSATVVTSGAVESFAGGIRTVGNDLNPWLGSQGASIDALFGIAKGASFDALQTTYLDPANATMLDGDLFVQVSDASGNLSPDRTRPVYAPILAQWLQEKAPEAFANVFGASAPSGDALATAAYTRFADLYAAFAGLDNLTRRAFLIDPALFQRAVADRDPDQPVLPAIRPRLPRDADPVPDEPRLHRQPRALHDRSGDRHAGSPAGRPDPQRRRRPAGGGDPRADGERRPAAGDDRNRARRRRHHPRPGRRRARGLGGAHFRPGGAARDIVRGAAPDGTRRAGSCRGSTRSRSRRSRSGSKAC